MSSSQSEEQTKCFHTKFLPSIGACSLQCPCFASCCTDIQQENLYVETINNIFFSVSYRSTDEIPTLPVNKIHS